MYGSKHQQKKTHIYGKKIHINQELKTIEKTYQGHRGTKIIKIFSKIKEYVSRFDDIENR